MNPGDLQLPPLPPPRVQVDQEQGLLALEQAVALREESVSVNVVNVWGSAA